MLLGSAGAVQRVLQAVEAETEAEAEEAPAYLETPVSTVMLIIDSYKLAPLKAMRARLLALVQKGDHASASLCADQILNYIGLRPFKIEEKR